MSRELGITQTPYVQTDNGQFVLFAQPDDSEPSKVNTKCFVEIFEDDNFDPDDPHIVLQGPKEYASLKDIGGKDWANDIESVIVGTNATVRAYEDRDFKGTELALVPGQRVKNLSKLDMGNGIESIKITCGK